MSVLVGLALLALLPGLLLARAPWSTVPALSLAFWALSPWWTPAALSRSGFLNGALLAFALLLGLRLLPKHELPPPPGHEPPAPPPCPADPRRPRPPPLAAASSLAIAAVALVLAAPAGRWGNAPGPRLAFQSAAARLAFWRDGVPLSSEPLLPVDSFGASAPAVATLAADLGHLAGVEPAPAVAAVVLCGVSLALLGAFALLATRLTSAAAALAALLALSTALAPLALAPMAFAAGAAGETVVALGFLLPAAALVVGHRSRASGFAAAWLWAAGTLVDPGLAALAAVVCALARPGAARLGGVLAGAVVLAAPGLLRLARALSPAEAASAALSLRPADLLLPLWSALAAVVGIALGRRLGSRGHAGRALAAAAAAVALIAAAHGWVGRGQLSAAVRRDLERLARETPPSALVCGAGEGHDWVPAVAARAADQPGPWIPWAYREEWAARRSRPCSAR